MSTMTLKQIDASIKSIVKRGKALREDAHKTLVAIILHHQEHGDYTRLGQLHAAVKGSLGSSIGQSLVQWVNDYYTGLQFVDGAFVHVAKVDKIIAEDVTFVSKDKEFSFEGKAVDLPFYRLEKPVNQAPFDFKARVLTLVTQAENARTKQIKEGKEVTITLEAIQALKDMNFDVLLKPAPKAEDNKKILETADQMGAEAQELPLAANA